MLKLCFLYVDLRQKADYFLFKISWIIFEYLYILNFKLFYVGGCSISQVEATYFVN